MDDEYVTPSVEDLLADPVARAMMACDGVSADEVRRLISQVRTRLRMKEGE